MKLEDIKKLNIPKSPGVYFFKDSGGKILYIGKAANLASRVLSYWQKSASHTPAKYSMLKKVERMEWVKTDSEIEALLLESNLVKKHQPPYNVALRDDKRFVYIKISTEDEIPGLFITRKLDRSGRYFGPFVSVEALKQAMKAIRKIWPYCTERKQKEKPCFYYHIGRCTGVCAGLTGKKAYKEKIIKPIILFFEGKKEKIIKDLEKERKILAKEGLDEEAAIKEYQKKNIERVLEHAHVLGLIDKYATDVIELAKVLGFKKVPRRIEGYDISNIYGREAVGSMVVFTEGESDKNEYRKFKIRFGQGEANDTRMLKEVLERRFNNNWPLPNLILVDGGRQQLNAAAGVLKKFKSDIAVIAISKGAGLRTAAAPDKLFFPGEKQPLQLPLASPALHLLKRVRDEAHRFAVGYHKKLRSKKFLEE